MRPAPHTLPADHFAALASGGGSAETIRLLQAGQLSKHILLVRAIVARAAGDAAQAGAAPRIAAAYELLSAAQRRSPQVVARLLAHPNVGAWAVQCMRRLHRPATEPAPPAEAPLWADLGYLAALAASAAANSGLDFEIDVPVRDGLAVLPGRGAARLPLQGLGQATVRGDGTQTSVVADGVHVTVPQVGDRAPEWLELRRLSAAADGLSVEVDLDDLDPSRCYGFPAVAGRLSDADVAAWAAQFTAAWQLLVQHHRSYAAALAAGLRSLIPQVVAQAGHSTSATSTDAFGAVALSLPPDPVALALALVHEFQHAKLSALLDLTELHQARADVRYYAPWRDDPRPLPGLLQGVYAFLGVTDFWRVQRHHLAGTADLAHFEFARWREQTSRAVEELSVSAELTEPGRQILAGARAALDGWSTEPVPATALSQAVDSVIDHRARWRIRNLRPGEETVAELTAAWQAGAVPPHPAGPPQVVAGDPPSAADTLRLRLWHLRLTAPSQFDRVCAGDDADTPVAGVTAADVAYVRGDYALAAKLYREQIEADPGPPAPWVGLALAQLRAGHADTAAALLAAPELVRAVHARLRESGEQADPESLAQWLHAPAVTGAAEPGAERT